MKENRAISLAIALLYVFPAVGWPAMAALPVVLGADSRVVSIPFRAVVLVFCLLMLGYTILVRQKMYKGWVWFPLIILWTLIMTQVVCKIMFVEQFGRFHFAWEWLAFPLGVTLVPAIALFIQPSRRSLWWAQVLIVFVGLIPCFLVSKLGYVELRSGYLQRAFFYTLSSQGLGRAAMCVAIVSLSILFFPTHPRPSGFIKIVAMVGFIVGSAVTFQTASRGPAYSLLIMLLIVLGLAIYRGNTSKVFIVFLLLAIGVGGYFCFKPATILGKLSELSIIRRIETRGLIDEWRAEAFRDAFSQFLKSPIIGSSFNVETKQEHSHSMFLDSLMITGVFGGVSFLLIWLASFRSCWLIYRNRPWAIWVVLVFLLTFVDSVFSSGLISSTVVWAFSIAVITVAHTSHFEDECQYGSISNDMGRDTVIP